MDFVNVFLNMLTELTEGKGDPAASQEGNFNLAFNIGPNYYFTHSSKVGDFCISLLVLRVVSGG